MNEIRGVSPTKSPCERRDSTELVEVKRRPREFHHGLLDANRTLCISSQTIYEFLAVATRSLADNGLAMNHADADAQLTKLLAGFEVLYDSPAATSELRRLVTVHQVVGKKIHDARLVATMSTHGVAELLTFNGANFKRFTHIAILIPSEIALGRVPAASPPEVT